MIYNNILEAMGNTPIIQLNKMVTKDMARVLVKFEGLNVGGSIKTRTAFNMIKAAEDAGVIKEDTIIVEPTSGNQGIGLHVKIRKIPQSLCKGGDITFNWGWLQNQQNAIFHRGWRMFVLFAEVLAEGKPLFHSVQSFRVKNSQHDMETFWNDGRQGNIVSQ